MSETRPTRRAWRLGAELLGVVLATVLLVPLGHTGPGDTRIQTAAAFRASSGAAPASLQPVPESVVGAVTSAPAPAVVATPRPTTTSRPRPVTTTAAALPVTSTAVAVPAPTVPTPLSPTTTTTPGPTTIVTTRTSAPAPTTTTTTLLACRNSTQPSCGAFRFDPQPGIDRPMTVAVVTEPAAPRAGEELVFRVTLTDPDGVSYGSTLFGYGDSGIGDTVVHECARYGPWDPPDRDPAHAVEVQTIRHTYAVAGAYPTSFAFDAGPFDCTDGATGRGDRPYASSATATLTVVVGP